MLGAEVLHRAKEIQVESRTKVATNQLVTMLGLRQESAAVRDQFAHLPKVCGLLVPLS
jgi:hypothetical protein